MAALGAPEVITQLESAAKVLMVRTSSPFSPTVGAVEHVRAVSGGSRRLEPLAAASLAAFFPRMCPVFAGGTAMRGALPRLSTPLKTPRSLRAPAPLPGLSSSTAALTRAAASGLPPGRVRLRGKLGVGAAVPFQRAARRQLEHLGLAVLIRVTGSSSPQRSSGKLTPRFGPFPTLLEAPPGDGSETQPLTMRLSRGSFPSISTLASVCSSLLPFFLSQVSGKKQTSVFFTSEVQTEKSRLMRSWTLADLRHRTSRSSTGFNVPTIGPQKDVFSVSSDCFFNRSVPCPVLVLLG